jgi:hypothetical protein
MIYNVGQCLAEDLWVRVSMAMPGFIEQLA